MTAEQCRAKVADLVAQAERIDLLELREAFHAQAGYLLERADELDQLGQAEPTPAH